MVCYKKNHAVIAALLLVFSKFVSAEPFWSDVPVVSKITTGASNVPSQKNNLNPHVNSRRVLVDYQQLRSSLASAVFVTAGQAKKNLKTQQMDLPMPYGGLQTFNVFESSVMEPELAAKYPQIKTYKIVSVSDQTVTGRLDTGPKGFHAYLRSSDGDIYIDPVSAASVQEYYSYYKRDYVSTTPIEFSCGVKSSPENESPVAAFKTLARSTGSIKTYRVAVAGTGEYSQTVKNISSTTAEEIKADALAEMNTAISRVNEIYERDLAIRFILVGNNDQIIFTDGASDPYTDPANGSLLLDENQATLDGVLGSSAYDVGHVLSTEGGGLAVLGVACLADFKARGESGSSKPNTDPFYIDLLAHELGHQLGANHTFNGTTDSCEGNRNAATAFEPGSGSSIMAYAGICGVENLEATSDVTFHAGSISEIIQYTVSGDGNRCGTSIITNQQAPVVNAGQDFTIPGATAFTLSGSATDPESDALIYQWDQMDIGSATNATTFGSDIGSNALFRSFEPVATAERTFPRLITILTSTLDKSETLPTENRTLNFRLTARDGNGGVDEDDMQIVVDGNAGPFKVLQPNLRIILDTSQPQSIQWDSACSQLAPVSCANVDILYTIDTGATFTSLVGGSTPNDGVELVNFPLTDANNARIKIACDNNIFFDVSDLDVRLSSTGGDILPSTVIGGSNSCGTATGTGAGSDGDIEPNNSAAQAQSIVIPSVLNGTVNHVLDPEDYFVFVASAVSYTFRLSDFASHDLDLILLDSTGNNLVKESASFSDPVEVINVDLVIGRRYNLVVQGYDTSAQDVAYVLDVKEKVATSGGGGVIVYYNLLILLMFPFFRRIRK